MHIAPVRRQLGLLGRAPSFRLLFLATFASGIGTWLAVIALTVDVFDRTGSAKWVSALLIADFLPAVAIGLLLGPLVDRLSRKVLMVGGDVVRFAVFCALPFADSAAHIVVLAAVVGVATGFFRPASYAGLPNLVVDDDLPAANSLVRTADYVTWTLGTLLGGAIVAASGPHLAYWLNAATFVLSALLLLGIPARRLQAAPAPSRGHWRDLGDGLRIVIGSRPLLTVLVAWSLANVAMGLINVSEIALAKVSFNAGDFGFGLMFAASGAGLAFGSLFAAQWLETRGIVAVYTGSIALLGFGTLAAAVSPNVWVAVWCIAVGGAGNGAAVVYNTLLVQRGAPDHVRGRAFTLLMGATFALMGIGMVAAGPLTDAVGARWVWGLAAGIVGVAAVVGHALVRGIPEEAPGPEPVPEAEAAARV